MKTLVKSKIEFYKYSIFLIIINIILWYGVIFQDGIVMQRDFNFPIFNENFISYSTYIWNDSMSQPNMEQIIRLFIRLPFIFLAYLGVGMDTILKLMILTTYTFVSISMFIFINEVYKISIFDNKYVTMMSSLLFAYNPVSLQFSGGISILFSIGILPLLLFLILKYQETNDKRFIILFSISLLFSIGHPFILMMNILISFIFSIYMFNSNILDVIKKYFFIIIIFGLMFSWFIIPYSFIGISSIDTGRESNLERKTFETVSDNNIYKILILERDKFTYINTFPEDKFDNTVHITMLTLLLIVSFIIPLFSMRSMSRSLRKIMFFAIFGYITTSLLSLGIKSPIGELYWYIVSNSSVGWIIRSPLKFQLYQSFFLIFLFAISISIILKKYNGLGNCYILPILILTFSGISGYGIVDANLNSLNPIKIPQQFYDINNILEEKNDTYKVIWYPRYQGRDTSWSYGHMIDHFDMKSSRKPTFNTMTNYNYVNDYLYNLPYKLMLFNTQEYYNFLSSIGVKYIAFHNDRGYQTDIIALNGIMNNSKKIYDNDNWYLFELNSSANIIDIHKHITLTKDIFNGTMPMQGLTNIGHANEIENKEIFENIISDHKDTNNILNYTKISSTTWKVNINSSSPFILSFSETYDKLWEAKIYNNGMMIRRTDAIPLYSVINGFFINDTGNLEVIVTYKLQRLFEIGLLISIITITSCIVYILYPNISKNRKKRDKNIL